MPRTYLESFYANEAKDLTNQINKHAQEKNVEIQSAQVFKSPESAWFEAIVVFERPIVYEVHEIQASPINEEGSLTQNLLNRNGKR